MIKKIFPSFEDARGKITDILQGEPFDAVTFISFSKDSVRANHFHKDTIQWNYVLKGNLIYRTAKVNNTGLQIYDDEITTCILKKGDMVISNPWEAHAFKGLKKSKLLVITRGPRAGSNYEKDTFRLKKPLLENDLK